MIINHKRKFVFVCVPKTGSTTLSKFFTKHDKIKIEEGWYMEKWHWPMFKIQDENNIEDYYSFAFHRNPYDRLVSSWIEFTEDKGHQNVWSQPLIDQFKTWEDFVLNFSETDWANEIHFRPTTWYTHKDGKQLVTYVAKYDNFKAEIEHIFESINMDVTKLPRGRRWRKTRRRTDYQSYYKNDKAIEAVANHFKQDIEIFGDIF